MNLGMKLEEVIKEEVEVIKVEVIKVEVIKVEVIKVEEEIKNKNLYIFFYLYKIFICIVFYRINCI